MSKQSCLYYLKPNRPWWEWVDSLPPPYISKIPWKLFPLGPWYYVSFSYYLFYIICKNFRTVVTVDLQLQPEDRNPILKNPKFLAKSWKKKKCNKISLEQAITFKTGQILVFNKRHKMTCKLLASDFLTAPSFCHQDVMTMSSLQGTKKGSEYKKISLFLRLKRLKYSEIMFKSQVKKCRTLPENFQFSKKWWRQQD